MTLGAIGFLNPWVLLALASLPAIWWLLRATPPRPNRVWFPATRLLLGLKEKERTSARSPWWLTLIRMMAAALVIAALAEPVLNPQHSGDTKADAMVILVDNGWSSASHWSLRKTMLDRLLSEAEAGNQSTALLATAKSARPIAAKFDIPAMTREKAEALVPQPYSPNRGEVLQALEKLLKLQPNSHIVWLSDGLDHGQSRAFTDALVRLSNDNGGLTVVTPNSEMAPLGLATTLSEGGAIQAQIKSTGTDARRGQVWALNARGERLAEVNFELGVGDAQQIVTFELPLELRNQVARVEISGERSAGAVHLLDSSSRHHRIGLISGSGQEDKQPLLSPLHYIERALVPFSEVVLSREVGMAKILDDLLERKVSTLMLANIGRLVGQTHDRLDEWVRKGGVLVRFAGRRLEQADDPLLPTPLRFGGRTLGGALSWSEPQKLGTFGQQSLFAGLTAPDDVSVNRQVLVDPARLANDHQIWARLRDGTPLVTARPLGKGWLVLFHVTANTQWSNLPLSGLFVGMLKRILTLGDLSAATPLRAATTHSRTASNNNNQATAEIAGGTIALAPRETLDGFGQLRPPPVTARPIALVQLSKTQAGPEHPPGIYSAGDKTAAINILNSDSIIRPLGSLPSGATVAAYESRASLLLKPWLLLATLGLIFLDVLAVIWLQSGVAQKLSMPGKQPARTGTAATVLLAALLAGSICALAIVPSRALAQTDTQKVDDAFALRAALKTHLAYVKTGNRDVDATSRLGLAGLGRKLAERTAVEPGEPIGIDIERDELAFFPIIYWPVLPDSQPLSDDTLSRIDGFMKRGGTILFDTRDYQESVLTEAGIQGPGTRALQRLLGKLDLPRIEPVPDGHVLTKSFYLLRNFPGRWDGGALWVEAQSGANSPSSNNGQARQVDGVSSILITANDFAAAWALDDQGRPLFATVPGDEIQREMAFRSGINIVMYALTGNYKADQVHVPALLERLGQ